MSFKGLKLAFDRMDHGDGRQGRAGNWEILLGGYDMGYEIYYQGKPIGRVNYELGEYELYLDGLFPRSELPMFLDAIAATGFKNVHEHEDEETCLESKRTKTMKKLNITKEAFEKSRYFTRKYGKLEYVSESGKLFKTNKGKVLMFKETYDFRNGTDEGKMLDEKLKEALENAYDKAHNCFANELEKRGFKGYDGDGDGGFFFNDFKNRKTYYVCLDVTDLQECDDYEGDSLQDEFGESTKKFGKKFAKESFDDMEKEFTYKGVTITRYDYESLPSPMAASKLSDEKMQEIAKDIYFELVNRGWDEKEIQKYVNNVDDYELPDAEMRIADKIRSDWWEAMEDVARYHGMEYYEDLPEEEENYTESKKTRFGKKFCKMDESMNWDGVTDKFIDNDNV